MKTEVSYIIFIWQMRGICNTSFYPVRTKVQPSPSGAKVLKTGMKGRGKGEEWEGKKVKEYQKNNKGENPPGQQRSQ
jgi:hypothetical protein